MYSCYGDDEDDEMMETSQCFLCEEEFGNALKFWSHFVDRHCESKEEFSEIFSMFDADQYNYLRFVNYMRSVEKKKLLKEDENSRLNLNFIRSTIGEWKGKNEYLRPKIMNDILLQFDIVDDIGDLSSLFDLVKLHEISTDSNNVQMKLMSQIQSLTKENEKLVGKLKKFYQIDPMTHIDNIDRLNNLEEDIKDIDNISSVCRLTENDDNNYICSYEQLAMHETMINDKSRTSSYLKAIEENMRILLEKQTEINVLDVGSGSGILSMFAAKSGATKVIGVEMAPSIGKVSESLIKKNNLNNKCQIVHGKLEDNLELIEKSIDGKKFDMIISEWMGYCLVFEGMLDSVLFARDRLMKENGIILPNKANIHVVLLDDEELYEKEIGSWYNKYDLDLSIFAENNLSIGNEYIADEKTIISQSNSIGEIDIMKVNSPAPSSTNQIIYDMDSTNDYLITTDGVLRQICLYFDVQFEPSTIVLSTSPANVSTHWKQIVLFVKTPINVKRDELVKLRIKLVRPKDNVRSVDIHVELNNKVKDIYELR
ncbi:hypothetical protein SNEBB_004290 [Seison nebaliae]|nr:hypothetical protein SNEBB_004290 [Seison nebaliae]